MERPLVRQPRDQSTLAINRGPAALALLGVVLLSIGTASGDSTNAGLTTETYELSDLNHLKYVLDEAEQEEYRTLDDAGRSDLMRVVWGTLDPTPTTELNERKEEHYKRLAYALENFAIPESPGWDRRGELLLRFGQPDWWTDDPGTLVHGHGLVPPSETWGYARLGLVFELEDALLRGDYQDAQQVRICSRPDVLNPRFNAVRTDGEPALHPNNRPPSGLIPKLLAERRLRRIEKGRASDLRGKVHFEHDYGGPPLTFAWDVQVFRMDSGASLVEVNAAYKADELGFQAQADEWQARVGVDAVVKTRDFREVGRLSRSFIVSQSEPGAAPDAWFLDRLLFEVDPGDYRLAFSARDSVNRALGLAQTELEVPDFSGTDLALSTVQLALSVQRGRSSAGAPKGGYQIVACPFRSLTQGPELYFYYEIYGLTGTGSGVRRYETDLVVQRRADSGSSPTDAAPRVVSTFPNISTEPTAREHVGIDTSSLEPGEYDVEILVRDLISTQTASRTISFALRGA